MNASIGAASGRPLAPQSGAEPEAFLPLLGRALRQLRAYPPSHAVCVDAIAACRRALVARSGTDDLVVRVAFGALHEEGGPTAGDPLVLSQLQRARVAELTIRRAVSERELARFALELIGAAETGVSLEERLGEHGITSIAVRLVPRPELVDVPVPDGMRRELLGRERQRRDAHTAPDATAVHLFPADKGWVRVDPALDYSAVSLTDLAVLIDDPAELAGVLARLGEDAADPEGRSPLERRFRDLTRIFASLEPALGRIMFGRLAGAVLAMDSFSRQRLLRETVLTGLLDGQADATILHDFPDATLAESLCLLLDLETAAPEVVTTALDRLGLSPERRSALEPLVEAEVEKRRAPQHAGSADADLERYARRLTRVQDATATSFSDFAAFDLAIDAATGEAMAGVQRAIHDTDATDARLACLRNLVRVEPNPEAVRSFLVRAAAACDELIRTARWAELASHVAPLRDLAADLRERRPEVADAIDAALAGLCTAQLATTLVDMHRADAQRTQAATVMDAFGSALAPALLGLLDERLTPAAADALVALLTERASVYAPALTARLESGGSAATAAQLVRVLGHAGAGGEDAIAAQLAGGDDALVREALRALTRVATPAAAAHIAAQLANRPEWLRGAALEALLRLPPALTARHVRDALGRTDLARRHPALMRALLDRTVRSGTSGMTDILAGLARLRFRFWNPAVARLGRRARSLLGS